MISYKIFLDLSIFHNHFLVILYEIYTIYFLICVDTVLLLFSDSNSVLNELFYAAGK